MPITPLHLGVLAPIRGLAERKGVQISFWAFLWVNLVIDAEAIKAWAFHMPLPDHPWQTHSFLSATFAGLLIVILGVTTRRPWYPSKSWVLGAFLGAYTHILLDMLVHPEMEPFYPIKGNPFYVGWREPLCAVLLMGLGWVIAQYVSGILARMRKPPEG